MKIIVDKIIGENVYFSTEYGNGKGIWKSHNKPIKKEYFVELDIDMLHNYDDFSYSKIEAYQMKICDEKILLSIILLEYDEFGCATFRLGDSIIEIETNYDIRFLELKNSYVTVLVEKLNIYDENI